MRKKKRFKEIDWEFVFATAMLISASIWAILSIIGLITGRIETIF